MAIFAPAGTPPDVIGKLTTGIRQALDALVKRETAYWAKIIKTANITAE